MFTLQKSLQAWNTRTFDNVFKSEVSDLDKQLLPLQKGLLFSSYVSPDKISPVIMSSSSGTTHLLIKTTIFYTGIIAGCSCADDPSPQDTQQESCDLLFRINLTNAETQIELI
jgi:hypothetical protein